MYRGVRAQRTWEKYLRSPRYFRVKLGQSKWGSRQSRSKERFSPCIRGSAFCMPPKAPRKTAVQNGQILNGVPQPQSRSSLVASCQIHFNSPVEKKPFTCPSKRSRRVLPLRLAPRMYRILILSLDIDFGSFDLFGTGPRHLSDSRSGGFTGLWGQASDPDSDQRPENGLYPETVCMPSFEVLHRNGRSSNLRTLLPARTSIDGADRSEKK